MKTLIQTQRLILREIAISDLDFIAAMLAHPEVMRYWPKCYSRAEAKDWIRKQEARYAADGYGYWLVIEKRTGEPVGQVGLLKIEIDDVEEIALGYIIHHPFWRRGYATEASLASLDYAFNSLKARHVIAPVRPENLFSQSVARKLGMTLTTQIHYAGYEHLIFSVSRTVSTE